MKQSELLKSISGLSDHQKKELEDYVLKALNLNEELKGTRPETCPHCHEKSAMIKKGFRRDKQRYQCKSCSRIFNYNSRTITSNLKMDHSAFAQIVVDTLNCVPLRKTAANLGLSTTAVFLNRHKILCALEELLANEPIMLEGTIEVDETYELKCRKGQKDIKKESRHRGGSANFNGLSREQVCIVTTTDRNGHEIFKAVGFGKPTTTIIHEALDKKLSPKSIIYADGTRCYDKVVSDNGCRIVHLIGHENYNAVEHLNTVNSIHSMIKMRMAGYRGVATKYMNRYLSLFVFIRRFMKASEEEKSLHVLKKFKELRISITCNDLKTHKLFSV